MSNLSAILAKEFKSDFRNPYSLAGALLFLLSSLFVCYITMKRLPGASIWVALFWIITLFASFNAIAKSFTSESRGRMLYLYSLVSPEVFIGAKAIYQSVILLVLSIVAMLVYQVLFEMVIQDYFVFVISLVFGSTGIAIILSLLSTIASKAGKNFTLLAILGLPVLLPLLMVTTTLMKNAIDGIELSVQLKYIFVLLGLNGVSLALALVLFPYLWRE
ncbi:MAG: ABC transporter permease [Flavobacteriales bacterium]|nr:ABC transporter permease [Flavobacteriales bacterium]NCG29937.1 ABC transporter permease [Bacteroidota bacterium]MBT3962536.1 ABC transporter permease [Flavobacteriales bacterium]MBT4705689.1 ABC transporter permease [Flavobacteriales bacterium]MBT4930965.1 ABC transporter permease [Flavobacteriales bacterium]